MRRPGGPCPNFCSGNGYCRLTRCECFDGFDNSIGDCSQKECPRGTSWGTATGDEPHPIDSVCSDRGECSAENGRCICNPLFAGAACEYIRCPNDCNHRGVCRINPDTTTWDVNYRFCDCDDGYFSSDCSLRKAPLGFDPLKDNLDLSHEVQLLSCSAANPESENWIQFDWAEKSVRIHPYHVIDAGDVTLALRELPGMNDIQTSFKKTDRGMCGDDQVVSITFRNYLTETPLPPMEVQTDMDPSAVFIVHSGNTIDGVTSVSTNRFAEECANRGRPDALTGECHCFDTFVHGNMANCGHALTGITSCPGIVACSARGTCLSSPTFRCACSQGWEAFGDCSGRTAPYGPSWRPGQHHIETECSSMGIPNRELGECLCSDGYTGIACERMKAPSRTEQECSGHGVAVMIGEAFSHQKYGKVFSRLQNEWDADRILVCQCAEGWSGHDCGTKVCPVHEDPEGIDGDTTLYTCSRRGRCVSGECVCFGGGFMGESCSEKRAHQYLRHEYYRV